MGARAGDDQRLWPDRDVDVRVDECAAGVGSGVVPIGSPVAGAALFVLDNWLRVVPAGWWVSCMWPAPGWGVGIGVGRG